MPEKLTDAQIECMKDGEPTLFGSVTLMKRYGRSVAAFRRRGWAEDFTLTPNGMAIYNRVVGEKK